MNKKYTVACWLLFRIFKFICMYLEDIVYELKDVKLISPKKYTFILHVMKISTDGIWKTGIYVYV